MTTTKFIPPYLGEEIKSSAEKKMFSVLQGLELGNAYILHSLGLPRHQSKVYGEIDFVVVCPLGVACLEIKGGRVECRDGVWFFTDRYGVERQKSEGPFAQVTGNMFSLKKVLLEKLGQKFRSKKILFGCGVVFPDMEFDAFSAEAIPEIVYDRSSGDITAYVKALFDYWKQRSTFSCDMLSPADIREIVRFLRGDYTYVETLGHRLDSVDRRLVCLTREQTVVMDALSENRHLLVRGGAGTGKTLLAMDYAAKQAAAGQKVLYLAYNKNLIQNVKRWCLDLPPESAERITVINIHALFGKYVEIDMDEIKDDPYTYFYETLPEVFYDWICSLSKEKSEGIRYDVLVVDEGQDILKPNYLYCLDALLQGGFTSGRWVVFYDEKQNLFNPEFKDGLDLLKSYSYSDFRLFVNCRNTIQIATFAAKAGQNEVGVLLKENGEEVSMIRYDDLNSFETELNQLMKSLRKEKVPMKNIVFLSPKKFKNSLLSRVNLKNTEIVLSESADAFKKDSPVFATIQGFKGLDSKVVIVIDVDKISDSVFPTYLYTACSRARTMLYLFLTGELYKRLS